MRGLLVLGAVLAGFSAGCQGHVFTDYRPLDRAGMWYGSIQELRGLDTTDAEVAQIVQLKQAGAPDEMCVEMVSSAHANKHPFASADAVINLSRAGFSDQDILGFARTDRLDAVNGDAVTLRLTGLSNNVVMAILNRRQKRLTTLSGPVIGRLLNTGLTEKQILERINEGMTDAAGEREAAARERARNKTGFVRNYGRRRR